MKYVVPIVLLLAHCFLAGLFVVILVSELDEKASGLFFASLFFVSFAMTAMVLAQGLLFRSRYRPWPGRPSMLLEDGGGRKAMAIAVSAAIAVGLVSGGVFAAWMERKTDSRKTASQEKPSEEHGLEVGDPLPVLSTTWSDGSEVTLAAPFDRPLLIHFWTSWDDAAIGQLRRLRLLADELGDEAPRIVGVCGDYSTEYPSAVVDELRVPWRSTFEPHDRGSGSKNSIIEGLGVKAFSSSIWIVGRDGTILAKELRGSWTNREIEKHLFRDSLSDRPAPEIETTTLDGEAWRLSDQRGKVVVLDFWATWCGPCKAETPNLKKLSDTFGGRDDFQLVGISLDAEADAPRGYCADNETHWLQLFEPEVEFSNSAALAYKVTGIPSIWVIGKDGHVAAVDVRGEAVHAAVAAALGG